MSSFLPGAVAFFMLPFYSHFLTVAEYGVIAAMATLGMLISAFSNLALDRAAQRFYFDYSDETKKKEVFGTFFLGSALVSLLLCIIFVLSEPVLQLAFPDIDFYPYFFITILSSVMGTYITMVQQYYRVSERALYYLLLIASLLVVQTTVSVFLIYVWSWGAFGQVAGVFGAACIVMPITCVIAYRSFIFKFDFSLFKHGLMFSWALIPTLFIAWVLNWSDQIFIARYLTLEQLGLYAMAYKVSMSFGMITTAVAMTFGPFFYRMANAEDQKQAISTLAKVITSISYGYVMLAFLIALFSFELVSMLLAEQYIESVRLIQILLISHLLSAIMGVSTNLFFIQAKKTKLQLMVVIVAAIGNVFANIILIPVYGIMGAAVATVLSMVILTFLHYHYSKKCYFIPIPWLQITAMITISSICIFTISLFHQNIYLKIIIMLFLIVYGLNKNRDLFFKRLSE